MRAISKNALFSHQYSAITNLVIDIGNTRSKAAVFCGGKLTHQVAWDVLVLAAVKELAYNQKVQNIILSSTAKVPGGLEDFLREKFFYLRLSHATPLPIGLRYATPGTLGRDRIAAAVGAQAAFPGENVLVIDAGTCITLDVVSAGGEFLGGNISPGIGMRLRAMHHFTARLPEAGRQSLVYAPDNLLGDSTENALRNGGELGALLEVKAMIVECGRQFPGLRTIFTGGDADFFVKNLGSKIFALPNLVLSGLDLILKYNVEKSEGL